MKSLEDSLAETEILLYRNHSPEETETESTDRVKKIREFLLQHDYAGLQTFDCRNWVGDPTVCVYSEDGVEILFCYEYDYLEIIGLTDEEYKSLYDVLYIC